MRLLLAQHGLAVDKHEDPARPLSKAGVQEVQQVARQLGTSGVRVVRVWHSGKLRAAQTAKLLAKQVMPKGRPETVDGIAPNDPVEEFAADVDVWQEDTLVVGHLPFMSRLVSLLMSGDAERECVRYLPGSIVCLEREVSGHWVLLWMLRPRLKSDEAGT